MWAQLLEAGGWGVGWGGDNLMAAWMLFLLLIHSSSFSNGLVCLMTSLTQRSQACGYNERIVQDNLHVKLDLPATACHRGPSPNVNPCTRLSPHAKNWSRTQSVWHVNAVESWISSVLREEILWNLKYKEKVTMIRMLSDLVISYKIDDIHKKEVEWNDPK